MQIVKERMQLMLDTMPLAAQIWSVDGQMLDTSLEAARLFEFSNVQTYKENYVSALPEYLPNGQKSLEFIQDMINEALENGTSHTEWTYIDQAGQAVPIDITSVRSSLHGETVILAFLRDMREHYANLEKLREADDYTKIMLDLNPLGTLVWDKDFTLVHCNKALAVCFGLTEAEEFISHFLTLIPDFQPDGAVSLERMQNVLMQTSLEGKAETPWMGKSITGEEVPCHVQATRTKYRGEIVIVAYVKDLRESEAQKKKLQIAEQRTQAILNGMPLTVNLLRPDFTILDCNDAAVNLTGHPDKNTYLQDFSNILPPAQPNGQSSSSLIYDVLSKTQKKGKTSHEVVILDRHKEELPLEITAVSAHLEHEDLYIVYGRDLRETKHMLKEIELAKEAAEHSARIKSEFLANMSHEIRTPMNGILGLLHLLSQTELNEHQQDYAQKALFSSNELLRIINDILDFSKIEAGKLIMEDLSFTLHDICSELQSLLGHVIYKKGLSFKLEEGAFPTTYVMGDPLRLKQVLLNLLSNAIKFTNAGSISLMIDSIKHQSSISNAQDELHCTFTVQDSGIGLSAEQAQNLFAPFMQADSSVTRKFGGTGLGLAISKSIVEMMQGKIWVESTLGEGSSFKFTAIFPLAVTQEITQATPEVFSTNEALHTEHLLLVEDNLINQLIAEELLKSVGYTLDIANNGQEALAMLNKKAYDAVLMDIQMPVMDGLTATTTIRQKAQFADLPIIAMSAHAMSGDKEKSLQHGMNDHITKPIEPSVLYATLHYWLSKKKQSK